MYVIEVGGRPGVITSAKWTHDLGELRDASPDDLEMSSRRIEDLISASRRCNLGESEMRSLNLGLGEFCGSGPVFRDERIVTNPIASPKIVSYHDEIMSRHVEPE